MYTVSRTFWRTHTVYMHARHNIYICIYVYHTYIYIQGYVRRGTCKLFKHRAAHFQTRTYYICTRTYIYIYIHIYIFLHTYIRPSRICEEGGRADIANAVLRTFLTHVYCIHARTSLFIYIYIRHTYICTSKAMWGGGRANYLKIAPCTFRHLHARHIYAHIYIYIYMCVYIYIYIYV